VENSGVKYRCKTHLIAHAKDSKIGDTHKHAHLWTKVYEPKYSILMKTFLCSKTHNPHENSHAKVTLFLYIFERAHENSRFSHIYGALMRHDQNRGFS
jgi:hypothetical protein